MIINKNFINNALPDNKDETFISKLKPNELSKEDKQKIFAMKANAVPSNRQDVVEI